MHLSPDTHTEGWDACFGYHYIGANILGSNRPHISGISAIGANEAQTVPFTTPRQTSSGLKSPTRPVPTSCLFAGAGSRDWRKQYYPVSETEIQGTPICQYIETHWH